MTLIEKAKKNIITEEIKIVAKEERVKVDFLCRGIAECRIVIPKNNLRKNNLKFKIIGIGGGLKTKVNANIGTSPLSTSIKLEREKLKVAIKSGTDTVMDLSTGGNLRDVLKMVLKYSTVPVGTVPIYAVACNIAKRKKKITDITSSEIFDEIEKQAELGVDFITVHSGLTRKGLESLKKSKRLTGIVSRGGSILAEWMSYNKKENPLYENFELLCALAYRYDLTLSLGDGLRPGSIADATDKAQIEELKTLGELAKIALKKNIQVMIEGPGHIPINQIEKNVKLAKKLCHNAPFYVLGPLTTDIAAGYDHITSAIGGAIAGWYGADFLCYVTPSEHISLPTVEDVKDGVIATRIAAHSADIGKGIVGAEKIDGAMSRERKNLNWNRQKKFAIDPDKFKGQLKKFQPCSMCGEFCSMRRKI